MTDAPGETWSAINAMLAIGGRGWPSGLSLARFLHKHRGMPYLATPLTTECILAWADAYRERTDQWPHRNRVPVAPDAEDTWHAIDSALKKGLRGLPGGSSLAQLLHAERGVRHPARLPRLEPWMILAWADRHRERTGSWPTAESGSIPEADDETWMRVESALASGSRGLPGGDSLARFLAIRRGKRNPAALSALTVSTILAWCDAHHARTGDWPTKASGAVAEAPGESWPGIHAALRRGRRGLPGGQTLAQLLATARHVRNVRDLSPLTIPQILAWADAHRILTGDWPRSTSGPVANAAETWSGVNAALSAGLRGLPGGASLARLLRVERGVRHRLELAHLTDRQVLAWARAHRRRTGEWPRVKSGPVADAPGESWSAIDQALREGGRGLPGGSSLHRVIHRIDF